MDHSEKLYKKLTGLFTGIEFTIRKVRIRDYMREMGTLPVGVADSIADELRKFAEAVRDKSSQDDDYEKKSVRFFLSKGVMIRDGTPAVWLGAESECPQDHVCFADLGSDADFLATRVAEFSFEMPGLKDLGSFFRGTGAGDAGPGGEEVRPEAVEPAAGNGAAKPDGAAGV